MTSRTPKLGGVAEPVPLRPKRYLFLTVGWAACLLLSAVGRDTTVVRALVPLTFTGLIVAGVIGISADRRQLLAAAATGAVWLISLWAAYAIAHPVSTVVMALLGVVFIFVVAFSILSEFLGAKRITADILWGAIGVYLLIGTAFGLLFFAVEAAVPGSLTGAVDQRSFVYFSLVTMTTLGYGDIAPASELARLLAAFTAICGVMYTAVIVARLVAIEIISASHRGAPNTDQARRPQASDSVEID